MDHPRPDPQQSPADSTVCPPETAAARGGRFATRVIHAGQSPDPTTGAVMTPIYATSTYVQQSPGVHKGFEYCRTQNPTRFAFERCVADLEDGAAGFAFASGLAATATVLELLDPGSHVVVCDDLYGGSFRLFERVRRRSAGLSFSYVDPADLAAFAAAIRPNDPDDLGRNAHQSAAEAGRPRRARPSWPGGTASSRVADNTFATPYIQRPLDPGLRHRGPLDDQVSQRALATWSAGSPWWAIGRNWPSGCGFLQNAVGGRQRAVRQLPGAARRQDAGPADGAALRRTPCGSPSGSSPRRDVQRVYYPGLASHPQHALARRQMNGFGGMVSAVLDGGVERGTRFLERCRMFALAESLGGVESLIEHPALMTHASIPAAQRAAIGIDDGLVRLSVGVEHVDDLIADLDAALR